eukprot:m.183307 g.183307  ORF g.183307 m.183307 type:complete len:120 (+) comp15783_c0_seq1:61-420(+)
MGSLLTTLVTLVRTSMYFVIITAIDISPEWFRRRVLSDEYSGKELDERVKLKLFGGWQMALALFHMTSINKYPKLAVGDEVPASLNVIALRDGVDAGAVPLTSLCRTSVPLVINFGSCS